MQKLEFEAAWDKTIAPQDRRDIEEIFNERLVDKKQGVDFIFLWEATNYKGDLLVAVLIENRNSNELLMENVAIQYEYQGRDPVISTFTLPFTIKNKTTMPWTFIYSQPNKKELLPKYKIKGM